MLGCLNQRGVSISSSTMQRTVLAALMTAFLAAPSIVARPVPIKDPVPSPRVKREIAGAVNTRTGERLLLSTDLGSIQIHTRDTDRVEYHAVAFQPAQNFRPGLHIVFPDATGENHGIQATH